jgi:hypothetical protein
MERWEMWQVRMMSDGICLSSPGDLSGSLQVDRCWTLELLKWEGMFALAACSPFCTVLHA